MRTTKWLCGLVLTMGASAPSALAFAGGGDGSPNLFAGDLGNIIWTLLIFGLVLFVLGRFAWGPILEGLQKRETFIHDALAKAKDDRDEAESRLREYEGILDKARAEATAIVEEGRRDADVLRVKIEADAKAEREAELARAKREIGIAKQTAVKELYELSGRLATDMAGRIIGRELTAGDHQRLIEESIAEIGQIEGN